MARRFGVTGLKRGISAAGARRVSAAVPSTAPGSVSVRGSQVASAVKRGVTGKPQTGVPAGNYAGSTKRRMKTGK
jgi:hypothetical protein